MGPEARIKLAGKRRDHASVHAIDEAALERSLIGLLTLMTALVSEAPLELRWLLRTPTVPPIELLDRWQRAVNDSQARFPISTLAVELQPDHACIRLTVHTDGWEEWGAEAAGGAQRCPVALVVAFLLTHVRYGHAALLASSLSGAEEKELLDQPGRLRALAAQCGSLVVLPRPSSMKPEGGTLGSAAGPSSPALLICGPRPALKRAQLLLDAWRLARQIAGGRAGAPGVAGAAS